MERERAADSIPQEKGALAISRRAETDSAVAGGHRDCALSHRGGDRAADQFKWRGKQRSPVAGRRQCSGRVACDGISSGPYVVLHRAVDTPDRLRESRCKAPWHEFNPMDAAVRDPDA